MDSILTSIKKLLGIAEDYEHFDMDIIMYINSALMYLNQLGVGPEDGFTIKDKSETWDDFVGDKFKDLPAITAYVYLTVRLIFDPPQTGPLVTAIEKQLQELTVRINIMAESLMEE